MTGIALVLALVGLVGFGRVRARSASRKLIATTSTIDDNALVTLTGTVKLLGRPLLTPLSGKPCVAYRTTMRSAQFGEITDLAMIPFVLVTRDSDVLVDGATCRLLLPGDPVIPRSLLREQRLLDRLELNAIANSDKGFDEACIEPGSQITVQGIAHQEPTDCGGETGFREAPTQIRLSGDDAHPLTIDRA